MSFESWGLKYCIAGVVRSLWGNVTHDFVAFTNWKNEEEYIDKNQNKILIDNLYRQQQIGFALLS